ncbi:unnamed protein product, partial [Phaeothamnion confervicola]
RLVVANTHLFFHPGAAHVRLMQMAALAEAAAAQTAAIAARGLVPAVFLLGDLNSPPAGPVRYLLGEEIGPDDGVWENVAGFRWGVNFFKGDGFVGNGGAAAAAAATAAEALPTAAAPTARQPTAEQTAATEPAAAPPPPPSPPPKGPPPDLSGVLPTLRSPLRLTNACGFPPFTNYTPTFAATLDYILADAAAAAVRRALPLPDEVELRAATSGLPAEAYPSDHLSLVAEVELLPQQFM